MERKAALKKCKELATKKRKGNKVEDQKDNELFGELFRKFDMTWEEVNNA